MIDSIVEYLELLLSDGKKRTAADLSWDAYAGKYSCRYTSHGLLARQVAKHACASKRIKCASARVADPHRQMRNKDTLVYWVEPE